jgi:flagellar hook-associated protein 2
MSTISSGIITSLGVGSGIDVESLITKLMAVEQAPLTALTTQKTSYNNQISALGQIKSALSTLQDSVKAFSTSSNVYSYKASVADSTIATATADSNAVAGTYSVEVQRLATTHKLVAAAGANPSAGGTLTIQVGSTAGGIFTPKSGTSPVSVTVGAGATLNDVRLAINSANAGVSASIVSGTGGDQLVITSLSSGETGQVKIGATAGLSGFSFDPVAGTGGLTQKTAGQDAIVLVDGIQIANTSSNTVAGAVSGLTLNLLQTNTGNPTTLTVANDSSSLKTKLGTLVTAYNSLVSLTKNLTSYDPTTKTAGILNGDSTVSQLISQIRTTLFAVPSGASTSYQTMSSLGVQFQSDGTLKLDSTVLQTAMDKDFASVAATVSSYGSALDTTLTSLLDTNGLIATRNTGLNSRIKSIDTRAEDLQRQLDAVQARYRAQFTALDVMVAQMQKTSTYLTQQLAALNKTTSSS